MTEVTRINIIIFFTRDFCGSSVIRTRFFLVQCSPFLQLMTNVHTMAGTVRTTYSLLHFLLGHPVSTDRRCGRNVYVYVCMCARK